MAALIRPRSWGQMKPPPGSQINWEHPLAQGLGFCVLLNEQAGTPVDLVTGVRGGWDSPNNAVWSQRGAEYSGINQSSFQTLDSWAGISVTCVWAGVFDSTSNFQALLNKSSGNGGSPVDWYITNGGIAWWYAGNGLTINGLVSTGVPYQLAATAQVGSGTKVLYRNGIAQGSGTNAGSGTDAGRPWRIGRRDDGATQLNGATYYAYAWKRLLSANELAWIYAEPYAFINPPGSRASYFPLSIPTVVTGTATVATLPQINAVLLNPAPAIALDLPAVGKTLFKTNLIFGTSAQTLGAVTSTASGSATAPRLPQVETVLFNPLPAIGIELPILQRIFKTVPVFGTVAQTLGSLTGNAQGSATAPQLPQLQVLLQGPFAFRLALPVLGAPLFVTPPRIFGSSATTLGAFTNSARGSVGVPQLPQVQALLLNTFPGGIELPILGPPLFSTRTNLVNGAIAQTLGAFTGAASGSVAAPTLPQLNTAFSPHPLGLQAPILGPALFSAPKPTITGTSATTLGSFTGAASGSTTPPTQPWLQAVLLPHPPDGLQLPLIPPRPPSIFGTASATLGDFTCDASGTVGPVIPVETQQVGGTLSGRRGPYIEYDDKWDKLFRDDEELLCLL